MTGIYGTLAEETLLSKRDINFFRKTQQQVNGTSIQQCGNQSACQRSNSLIGPFLKARFSQPRISKKEVYLALQSAAYAVLRRKAANTSSSTTLLLKAAGTSLSVL